MAIEPLFTITMHKSLIGLAVLVAAGFFWVFRKRQLEMAPARLDKADSNVPLVRAVTFPTRLDAEYAKSILDSNAIQSYVAADDAGGMESPLLTAIKGAAIVVKASDADRARELLKFDQSFDPAELDRAAASTNPPLG